MLSLPLCANTESVPNVERVSVTFKNTPLSEALKKLEKVSGYKILFTYDDVRGYRVTATIRRATIDEALRQTLAVRADLTFAHISGKGGEQYISVTLQRKPAKATGIIPPPRSADTHALHGFVADEQGDALIGATVRVPGSDTGAVTDTEGSFSLTLPASATKVEVSFVGMQTQTVSVKGRNELRVVLLADDNVLSDVVVTGYQTISRERSAGSYGIIKGETISDKVGLTGDILQSMEGMTAGLGVNLSDGADAFTVRGITSINSSRSPLFVVDGVPLERSQVEALVGGNDIASITVLKDAMAASIWGSQAANGVVVITTKSGTRGSRLSLSYDGSFAFTGKPDYDYQHKMSNAMFLKNAQEMFDQYSDTFTYDKVQTSVAGLVTNNPVIMPHERIMYRYKNGELSAAERDAAFSALLAADGRKDYEHHFMSDKLMTRHTISLSGGSDRQDFYLSLGYVGKQGTARDWGNAVTINAKQNFSLAKWLKWDVTVNASYGDESAHLSPWNSEFAEDKIYSCSTSYTDLPYAVFNDAAGAVDWSVYTLSAEKRRQVEALTGMEMSFYPIDDYLSTSSKTTSTNLRLGTGLTVDLFKGLRYEGRVQYSRFHSKTEDFYPGTMWKLREERLCATPATTLKCPLPSAGGNFMLDNGLVTDWTVRNQLSYNNEFGGGRHMVTALFGTEVREYKNTVFSNFLRGYDMHTMQYTAFDEYNLSRVMGAVLGGSVNNFYNRHYSQTEAKRRYFSLYANAAYTFLGRYTLNASMRMDQSNLFGSDPDNQYKPIWAVGGAWKMKEEKFLHDVSWLNALTLRATFGFAGNSPQPGQGGSYDILQSTSSSFFETNGYSLLTPANDKIIWEKTRTWNIGLDASALSHRLTLSVDYYDKRTTDLIGTLMLNPTSGWLSTTGNLGTMTNRGFELTLNSHNIKGRDFNWHTTLTFSHNANNIERLDVATPYTAKTLVFQSVNMEGYPAGALFSYRYAGLNAKGEPQAYDKAGNIVAGNTSFNLGKDDVVYSGTVVPKIYGGLTNRLTYKAWELSFLLVYNLGNKMRRDCEPLEYGRPVANLLTDFDRRWRTPGDELTTDIPAWTPQKNSAANYDLFYRSDRNILDASYIKLRDLSLSYRLPSPLCRRLHLSGARIMAQAGNLFYWAANNAGIDPEYYRLDAYSGGRTEKPGPTFALGLNINL